MGLDGSAPGSWYVTERRSADDKPPEWFVNTATAPRVIGTVAGLIVTALGLWLVWLEANHPLWRLGPAHPVTIATAGLIVCVGLGLIIYVWRQSDSAWRRVPDGPLSTEFRALADTGRVREAMDRLREETGAGYCEARQVVELYLARRLQGPTEPRCNL
jgi:hypothetical protein